MKIQKIHIESKGKRKGKTMNSEKSPKIAKIQIFFFTQHAVVKARKAFSSDRWEKRKKRN